MLSWAQKPNKFQHSLINDALAFEIDIMQDCQEEDYAKSQYPLSSRLWSTAELHRLMKKLYLAHNDTSTTYHATDYHYLILWELLEVQIDIHNDLAKEAIREHYDTEERYRFARRKCSIEDIDGIFWDTDFLFDSETMMRMPQAQKDSMGLSPETFGLCIGLKPHPEETLLFPETYGIENILKGIKKDRFDELLDENKLPFWKFAANFLAKQRHRGPKKDTAT